MSITRAVVLAAGRGSRFEAISGSKTPKLLQTLQGQPVICHVLDHIKQARIDSVTLVVGYKAQQIRSEIGAGYTYLIQEQQSGSGNAVATALKQLHGFDGNLLIMCGDSPLVQAATIRRMLSTHASERATITLLTANLDNPTDYGRVLRSSDGAISGIVEQSSARGDQLSIREVNGGAYVFDVAWLASRIESVAPNASGETNLTGSLEIAASETRTIAAVSCEPEELLGVNTPAELQMAELLAPDLARAMTKRAELLEDGRRIAYYTFGSDDSSCGCNSPRASDSRGGSHCPS